ncbi:hypothetical protein Tco_1127508 [Tanacetum coccineum]
MASMNTRLNIKKLDENIVQKHGGSKQVGLKQLGSKQVGSPWGKDANVIGFEVELQRSLLRGSFKAEVFAVPGQRGCKGYCCCPKKKGRVYESNLRKLLKVQGLVTRRSTGDRGSSFGLKDVDIDYV